MHVRYSLLASQATTALFVLLWGSAAIFTRWGLDNASPMALLVFRFLVALVALAPLIAIQIMGLIYAHKAKSVPQPSQQLSDDTVVELEEE